MTYAGKWAQMQAYAEKIRTESRWRGQCASAYCGDSIPLHKLDLKDRADPEFMSGYYTGEEFTLYAEWVRREIIGDACG